MLYCMNDLLRVISIDADCKVITGVAILIDPNQIRAPDRSDIQMFLRGVPWRNDMENPARVPPEFHQSPNRVNQSSDRTLLELHQYDSHQ